VSTVILVLFNDKIIKLCLSRGRFFDYSSQRKIPEIPDKY
jgi:hypothetical protein